MNESLSKQQTEKEAIPVLKENKQEITKILIGVSRLFSKMKEAEPLATSI